MKNKERLTTLSVVSLKNLKPSKKVSSAIDYIKDVIQRQPNRIQEGAGVGLVSKKNLPKLLESDHHQSLLSN